MSEFTKLSARLAPLGEAVEALEAGVLEAEAEAAATGAWLSRATEAEREMHHLAERFAVFRARALEKDPDKKVYGESMCERVLSACRQADNLVERWSSVARALPRLRGALAEQGVAAAAAAAQAERLRAAAEEAAVASRAAAAVEEATRKRDEDALRAREAAASAKAAAARVLSSAAPVRAPIAPTEADGAIAAAQSAFDGAEVELEQALGCVRAASTIDAYGDVVQVCCLLLSNIQAFPEERGFKSVRLRNQLVHRHFAARRGAFELLRALGFTLRDAETDEPALLFEEPNVELHFEAWASWFERLKASIARLQAELRALRLPALPTAVKGGQNGLDAPPSGRRQGPQVATLSGSSGGGM